MPITRIDLTTLKGRIIAALNAATAGTWSTSITASDDSRRNTTEVEKAALAADAQICLAICETGGHGYRSLFMTDSTDLSHGEALPDHISPPGQVRIKYLSGDSDYKAGKFDEDVSLDDIERWRANVGALYGANHNAASSSLSGFYRIQGVEIFFTGHRAIVKLANFTRTAACQAPEAYEDAALAIAVMNLVKEGDRASFAQVFASEAASYLALIRGGALTIPPLQLAQTAP